MLITVNHFVNREFSHNFCLMQRKRVVSGAKVSDLESPVQSYQQSTSLTTFLTSKSLTHSLES